eukprot:200774-Rhodomonas_salina.1
MLTLKDGGYTYVCKKADIDWRRLQICLRFFQTERTSPSTLYCSRSAVLPAYAYLTTSLRMMYYAYVTTSLRVPCHQPTRTFVLQAYACHATSLRVPD